MKKYLPLLAVTWFFSTVVNGQELIQNRDFELPDDGKKYSRIDSIPAWLTDDVTADACGREIIETNGVAWHWDGAGSIYQVIGTVPSTYTSYDISFNVTCYYSYWSGDYITDVYAILSAYSGDDPSTRVPFDTITFTVSAMGGDWMEWVTKEGEFEIEAGNEHAGENLVFEIEIFDSRDFGYSESWTYLYYDDVSVYMIPSANIKDVKDDNLKVIITPEMLKITCEKAIESAVLFDISGKRIIEITPNSTNVSLDIAYLNHGIYILNVKINGERLTRKVAL